MKLFTKEVDKQLFAQYSKGSDLENQMVVAKIFNPYGRGVWYLLNSDPEDPDYIWAIVDLFEPDMGSVSRSELQTVKVPPFGLGLERDMYFTPKPAKEVWEGILRGERFEKGGSIASQNKDMLENQTTNILHHAEELHKAVKNTDIEIMPWVLTKIQRASTDLADVTHYLDGENKEFGAGGMTAGRWYKDNSGKEYRFIGESQGKLLFNDGEKIVEKDEEDFEEEKKEKKLFGFFADGGRVKGRNNQTGESYGVVIGSVKKADEFDGVGIQMNVRSGYESRICESTLYFDNDGNLLSITDYGCAYDGNYPSLGVGSGTNYNADKKETLQVLSKKYNAAFAKKLIELAEESKMADGGELDWGADLGDGFSVGNDVFINDKNSRFYNKNGYVIGKLGQSLVIRVGSDDMDAVIKKSLVEKLDAPEFEKGGKINKRYVKLTLSDKDSYDYTYVQDGATASITFGFGKEPFTYEVKKISKSLEPLKQDILDTFVIQGIRQHEYKGGYSEAIKHLDTSILQYPNEFAKGGDLYDDMDPEIAFTNKKAKAISELLKNQNYKVVNFEKADYDSDASIELSSKTSISIGLDGHIDLVIEKEKGKFTFIDCGNSIATLLQKLSKVEKKYMAKGGSTNPSSPIKDSELLELYKRLKNKKEKGEELEKMEEYAFLKAEYQLKNRGLIKNDKMAEGGKINSKYNLSFNYNPSNLSNEEAEKIVSKYTKNWKHDNDFDEVSFYVMGLSKSDSDNLHKELKMEDVYNIEIEKSRYAMGGKVKFEDKVKAIKASLLKRKKVSPKVQKDYGKTYSPKEAEESAKRIVGAQTAKYESKKK